MRKVLVLGVVGFGFLVGCLSPDERKEQAAQRAANQLATYRFLCQNDYGIKDNTPAMSSCMQDMDKEASRRARDAHQSMIKILMTAALARLDQLARLVQAVINLLKMPYEQRRYEVWILRACA